MTDENSIFLVAYDEETYRNKELYFKTFTKQKSKGIMKILKIIYNVFKEICIHIHYKQFLNSQLHSKMSLYTFNVNLL